MAVSDNTKREMYITLLHLVHQKTSTFKELLILLDRKPGFDALHIARNVLGGIYRKIKQLESEWNEKIPKINVFIFGDDGKVTSWVVGEIYEGVTPTQEQIDADIDSMKTYDKWDEVLEAFKYWK